MNFKNLMLFIVLGLMTFSSCKKDDTATGNNLIEENKAKLVGTWNVTEIVDMDCNDSADNETQTFGCETQNGVEVCTTVTLTFAADGIYTFSGSTTEDGTIVGETEEGEGTWEIIDATQMTLCLEGGDCSNETYVLTDNNLTTTSIDTEFGCTTTVTATK
jgi:hypothetical protein